MTDKKVTRYSGASPSQKRDIAPYHGPRTRQKGEAGPMTHSNLHHPDPYKTGMGEERSVNRPGSDAAYAIPSRGISA